MIDELAVCPYCETRPVSIGRNKKPNRTCGGKECVRQATSKSAAKLSVWSTSIIDESPRGFAPTRRTKTAVVSGKRIRMRMYRNPDGITLWSSSPPVEPPRRRGAEVR